MNLNFIFTEIVLWGIAVFSGVIAHEFYKSKDGRLRVLIISLFLVKIWVYGGAAIIFCFHQPDKNELLRIFILNIPMFIVMLKLWEYIRTHNK